jgi:hypothetical protein
MGKPLIPEKSHNKKDEWMEFKKPLFVCWCVLFVPVSIMFSIWLENDNPSFSLILLLGAIFSSFGAFLVIAMYRSIKDFVNNFYEIVENFRRRRNGTVEDFKKRNGYYPKTKYHAYAELWLRAIRAIAVFYLITTPIFDYADIRLVIGTILLYIGIIGLASMLIEKTRIRPDTN